MHLLCLTPARPAAPTRPSPRPGRLLVALIFCSCGGGGGALGPGQRDARDVSGNYELTYDDRVTLRLDVGGAVREVTQRGFGGVVDFGSVNGQPVRLDLSAFCARADVKCPSEAFWPAVAITQPNLSQNRLALQQLTVVNGTTRSLPAGQRAASLSGLVDHDQDDRFILGLGLEGGATDACLALSVSSAQGRFTRVGERFETSLEGRTPQNAPCALDGGTRDAGATDAGLVPDGGARAPAGGVVCTATAVTRRVAPPNAAIDGIDDGTVSLAWAGGCAFGPVLVGAILTLESGFTGRRTGAFDPPPFTPAPVVLPDGGAHDGGP
ncbi:MAG: hypothetical protein INH41_25380 [Myxococcaceae bacterium]|nr:hypothetical protein [Myxococcaceae bacterium]